MKLTLNHGIIWPSGERSHVYPEQAFRRCLSGRAQRRRWTDLRIRPPPGMMDSVCTRTYLGIFEVSLYSGHIWYEASPLDAAPSAASPDARTGLRLRRRLHLLSQGWRWRRRARHIRRQPLPATWSAQSGN